MTIGTFCLIFVWRLFVVWYLFIVCCVKLYHTSCFLCRISDIRGANCNKSGKRHVVTKQERFTRSTFTARTAVGIATLCGVSCRSPGIPFPAIFSREEAVMAKVARLSEPTLLDEGRSVVAIKVDADEV
jgi:hypothetical protein